MVYSSNRTHLGSKEQELQEQNELLMNYIDTLEEQLDKYNECFDILTESKMPLGYKGTSKVEKKYKIPQKYCIKTRNFMSIAYDTKNSDKILDQIKNAVKYIKDEDDMNQYFSAILRSAYMYANASTTADVARFPILKKLYNLYEQNYKGSDKITQDDLLQTVKNHKFTGVK